MTDGQTDRRMDDKVIPMCRFALQATQKNVNFVNHMSPPQYIRKVIVKVKVDNRQTGQKQYATIHSIWGHKYKSPTCIGSKVIKKVKVF